MLGDHGDVTKKAFVLLVAVEGVLKGYDPLLNLVLDETKEYIRGVQPSGHSPYDARKMAHVMLAPFVGPAIVCRRPIVTRHHCGALVDPDDPLRVTDDTRNLGLIVRAHQSTRTRLAAAP